MTLRRLTILGALAGIVAGFSAPALAQPVADAAYPDFRAGRYGQTFNRLFRYRLDNTGTLRVDFMLAVSSCRLNGADQKALGGYLLRQLDTWYGPLNTANRNDVRAQAVVCPLTQMSYKEAVASISGKADEQSRSSLAAARTKDGAGASLPVAPAASDLQPLLMGMNIPGGDIRNAITATPELCTVLCSQDQACRAVTWIRSQKRCWLKRSVAPAVTNADMVSARKQP